MPWNHFSRCLVLNLFSQLFFSLETCRILLCYNWDVPKKWMYISIRVFILSLVVYESVISYTFLTFQEQKSKLKCIYFCLQFIFLLEILWISIRLWKKGGQGTKKLSTMQVVGMCVSWLCCCMFGIRSIHSAPVCVHMPLNVCMLYTGFTALQQGTAATLRSCKYTTGQQWLCWKYQWSLLYIVTRSNSGFI